MVEEVKMIECLACGWKGKEEELHVIKAMGENDCVPMDVDVCSKCHSVAWEEVDDKNNREVPRHYLD